MKTSFPVYPLSAPIVVREARGDQPGYDRDMLIPHRKGYYLFVLVRQGDSRHWIDARSYTLRPDHFYFTVPHQVHLKEEPRPMQGLVLAFTQEFLQLEEHHQLLRLPILANRAGGHELRLSPADVVALEQVMRQLLAEYQGDGVWRSPMMGVLLHQLLIHLSRLYLEQLKEDGQEETILQRFLELVMGRYSEVHEVNAYAALLHISAGHLNDVVKQQSGKTCIEHIQDILLVEARRRLLHTELPVNQICDELGFEDAAYFNRFFKRHAGVTPLTYRKQIREKYHYVLPESSDAVSGG
jgi:AraC family transcriptional regulator, transcriptional activator of pobA